MQKFLQTEFPGSRDVSKVPQHFGTFGAGQDSPVEKNASPVYIWV